MPSLAGLSFPASRFEREMRDLFGIDPVDHPHPRRLVLHQHWPDGWHPMRRDAGDRHRFGDAEGPYPFLTVEGPGVYEIPVGPVHAGLIEPGHFRFSVVGETILKMKARLWFVHKGIERLFEGRDLADAVRPGRADQRRHRRRARAGLLPGRRGRLRLAAYPHTPSACARSCSNSNGSTTTSPTSARCATTSASASLTPTPCASANNCCASTPRSPVTGSCAAAILPGGAHLCTPARPGQLDAIAADIAEIVDLALGHSVVGTASPAPPSSAANTARDLGTLGYVARASGLPVDARHAHPFHDRGDAFSPVTRDTGGTSWPGSPSAPTRSPPPPR